MLLAPLAIPIIVLLNILGIGKVKSRTPAEVAGFFSDFINGTGGNWDWDDFTSVPIKNPELDALRREAAQIDLPTTTRGREQLNALFIRAEALKVAWIEAGQPE